MLQYSVHACTCAAGGLGAGFGFLAGTIVVRNYESKPVYLNFGSTGAASSSDLFVSTGDLFTFPNMRTCGVGWYATASGGEFTITAFAV